MKEGLLPTIDDAGVMVEVNAINETIAGAPLKRYDDSENLVWVGASISSFGFTINEDALNAQGIFEEDYPSTWYDLASPKYWREGRQLISIGNAPDTTSNRRIYEIILQGQGWETGWGLISAIAGNSEILGGSVDVLNSVITAEAGIAVTIDFYGYEAQLTNPACRYIIPQNQSIINADPICLIDGDASKRSAANAFLEFVLSKDGQKIWMENAISRLPARGDFGFEKPDGTVRTDLEFSYNDAVNNQGIEFSDSLSLETSNSLIYYFESVLTDSHVDLQTVWQKLADMYNADSINDPTFEYYRNEIGSPMMTLDYAKEINDQILSDSSFRTSQQETWQTLAISQYASVSTELDDPVFIPENIQPILSVYHLPTNPNQLNTVTILSEINPIVSNDTQSVHVNFRIDDSEWDKQLMLITTPNLYIYDLPLISAHSKVDYYIEFTYSNGTVVLNDNFSNYYSFIIDYYNIQPIFGDIFNSPSQPDQTSNNTIFVSINSELLNSTLGVTLHYRINDSFWIDNPMILISSNLFASSIGLISEFSVITYYIELTFINGSSFIDNNSNNYYSFSINYHDIYPPIISDITITSAPYLSGGEITFSMEVDDYSGISAVMIKYRINSSIWYDKNLENFSNFYYTKIIPFTNSEVIFEYYFIATDNSNNIAIYDNDGIYYSILIEPISSTPTTIDNTSSTSTTIDNTSSTNTSDTSKIEISDFSLDYFIFGLIVLSLRIIVKRKR